MENKHLTGEKEVALGPNEPVKPTRVYFIRMKCSTGYIKIGVAEEPLKRMRDMQTGSPYPLELLHDIPGGFQEEAEMHRQFEHLHWRGEWFYPGEDLLSFAGIERKKREPRRRMQQDDDAPAPRVIIRDPVQDALFREIAIAGGWRPPADDPAPPRSQ